MRRLYPALGLGIIAACVVVLVVIRAGQLAGSICDAVQDWYEA